MRIIVTGATGFIGSALLARLAAMDGFPGATGKVPDIVAMDSTPPAITSANVRPVVGDIADPAVRRQLLEKPVDLMFHLAAIPGGGTERNYDLGWAVNIEASFAIFRKLAAQEKPARLVFASSIGVFGVPLPADSVDDETLILPTMSYGAQKLMGETLLADYSRRGLIDGLSVRLPGIVARPRVKGGHTSAFMSEIFHALAAGDEFVCPVSENATSWVMSRERCIDNLIHAAGLPSERLPPRRAFNLPALRLSMTKIVDALAARFGDGVRDLVVYRPEKDVEAQYAGYPPLVTPMAQALGFRNDGDADALTGRALGIGEKKSMPMG